MRVLAAGYPGDNGPRPAPPPAPRFMTIVGQPKTIALQYARGKVVRSRLNGQDQMMYTLTSGERAYFDMHVAQAIDSLTLAPGQPFTVCHHGGGNWDIERAAPAAMLPQQEPPAPRAPAAQPARYWGNEQPAADTSPETDTRPAPLAHHNQRVNGQGQTAADLYLQDFQSAIDIVLAGVPLANAKGLMVAPSFEDIRCIATHLAISRERQL